MWDRFMRENNWFERRSQPTSIPPAEDDSRALFWQWPSMPTRIRLIETEGGDSDKLLRYTKGKTVTTSQRIDGGKEPGVEQDAPRKVALIANCLLNQNAKVCEGARYRGMVNPVVEALRSRGYQLQQLPCPELAFAGARRWWAVYEQYDTPAYRAHCRRLAQAIAPLIEQYLRRGDEVILIGLDGSPSSGVRFTSSKPDWGGRPNRPEDDWDIVPRRGVWIEELEAELARRGLPALPATGWALDMGRFDEAGSRRDLEQFLDSREIASRSRNDDSGAGQPAAGEPGAGQPAAP
jgi:predicted secreted protein